MTTLAPDLYRATLRSQIRDVLRTTLEDCAANARTVWAATIGVPHQHIDRAIARDGDKALHVADALAAPEPVRHALAQALIGDSHVIAQAPLHGTSDDFALLAKLVREQNATLEALITAAADATITTDEGARIERAAHRSMQVTAAVRELGRRAVSQRGLSLVPRAGTR